jgi:phenylalanyl-tRNA synthetase beta chain
VFALVSLYGLDPEKLQIKAEAPSYYHPGQSCSLYLGKTLVAVCGMIHPLVLTEFKDVERSAAAFELYYDNLPAQRLKNARAKLVLSNFQKVERDFAFVMNDNISASELTNLIKGIDKNMIESVDIFDVYYGKNIEAGKKSVAFNVKIQPVDKTLSEDEINAISKKIVDEVTLRFSATLR